MSISALIVAAGRGSRAGGPQPKQWQGLAGARVIDHTLAAFRALPQITEIVLVLHEDDMDQAEAFAAQGVTVTTGKGTKVTRNEICRARRHRHHRRGGARGLCSARS